VSLAEQARKRAESAPDRAFYEWAPRKAALDPRNLWDDEGLHPLLNAAPIVGNVLDAASTTASLNRGNVELNPIVRPIANNAPVLMAGKLTVGVLTALAADRLAVKGHRKLAKALAILGGAVPVAAAVHNTRQR